MGVELVTPEALSFLSWTNLALGAAISLLTFLLTHVFNRPEEGKSRWRTSVGEVAFLAICTLMTAGIFSLMERSFDNQANDAVELTHDAMEEHYEITFLSGNASFDYDARSDEPSLFDVSFIAENGSIYQGRVNIVDGYATLDVPQDMETGQYVEYPADSSSLHDGSVTAVKTNTIDNYANWIALVLFAMIGVSFVVGWKFEVLFQEELIMYGRGKIGEHPKRWRWLVWSVILSVLLSAFAVLLPGLFISANDRDTAAEETLATLEEKYGIAHIDIKDEYFGDYGILHWKNGIHVVSFAEGRTPKEGYLRTKDGELSLYVLGSESSMEYVEYDERLLN